jgi:hypothetical protein
MLRSIGAVAAAEFTGARAVPSSRFNLRTTDQGWRAALGVPEELLGPRAARLRDPSTFWAASSQPTTCFDAAGPVVLGLLAAAEKLAGARVEARAGP